MARNVFTTTIQNQTEILGDLDALIRDFPDISKRALSAQQAVVEEAIKHNWVSMGGGKAGDYVYDSVGKNTTFGANGSDVVGMTGVFNIDSVRIAHGKEVQEGKRKPLNAAQIAYWVNFGTSRLRIGGRKRKSAEYNEEDLIRVTAKPFISNAFYQTLPQQQQAFINEFSKVIK